MSLAGYSLRAGGDIAPSRFVTQSTTTAGTVTQATAGAQIYGISGESTRYAPYSPLDDGLHATTDENCLVYGAGRRNVKLELGGTVTRGDRLKSDSDGKGVTTATDHDEYGAVAEDSGVSGDLIPVTVTFPTQVSHS